MNIEIAGSLLPGSTNTLIDSRGRIETLTEIKNIKLPAVGMLFYCMETEKIYVVKTLKNGTLNGYTLADLQIESYEEIGGGAKYVAGDGISISEENVISVDTDIPEQNFDYNALENKPKFIAGDGIKIEVEFAESLIVSGAGNAECNGTYELADHKKKGTARVWQKSNRKIYHDGTKWLIDSDDDGASFYYSATGESDPWTLTFSAALSEFGNAPSVARATSNSSDRIFISADFSDVIGDINSILDDINGEEV